MSTERLTVSFDDDLALAVRAAADSDERNVSAWLANAARRQLATRGLADVVAEWESQHGTFTAEELELARQRLNP